MPDSRLYEDIARRTGGDIYIGVVGPVRTGKSTFIKRFMESSVIPSIENIYIQERTRDELPQSGSGRTIMTAEPKFIPEEAVTLQLDDGPAFSLRMVDCVGYMVEGAVGLLEDGEERMVTTPWHDVEIPLTQAAEEGTSRVIRDHSTIGVVVTCDGSICGIPREAYMEPEARAIRALKEIGKPFAVVLNSTEPDSSNAQELRKEIGERYGVDCLCMNCQEMGTQESEMLMRVLLESFPVSALGLYLPSWIDALPPDRGIRKELFGLIAESFGSVTRLSDVSSAVDAFVDNELVEAAVIIKCSAGTGRAEIRIELPARLYYETISEETGFVVSNDAELMSLLAEMGKVKKEYDKISAALCEVRETGYGVVMPSGEDMQLEEPEIVKQGGRYGVKLKASAPSLHMMMTTVETEVSPALGGEQVSEEIMGFLLQEYNGDASKLWDSNIFGKSLYDIAGESLSKKITDMSALTQAKLRDTVERLINGGSKRLICILF